MLELEFHEDKGLWRASLDGHHQASGMTKDNAVFRLSENLRNDHSDVYEKQKSVLDAYWEEDR
jgi:hypothetical protein